RERRAEGRCRAFRMTHDGGSRGLDTLSLPRKRERGHRQRGCSSRIPLPREWESARVRVRQSWALRFRYSSTGRPPQPQFSVSTSSMTTKVASRGLFSTSSRSRLTPAMSLAFSSAVTALRPGPEPSRVTWIVTIGMEPSLRLVAGALTAVDGKDLARHGAGGLKIEDGVDDIADVAHALHRMQRGQEIMSLRRVHRRFDDAGRNGIHPDALRGIFDGERLRGGVDAALGQIGKHGRHRGNRMIGKAGADVDDVAGALLQLLGRGAVRDVEEAGAIGPYHRLEVSDRIVREGLGDEDAGIVDERVDPPEARQRLL